MPAISAVSAPITAIDLQRLRRVREQHGVAADHVDARRHHRRRVDERGDRRRAFHRVRQPDIQRNLRRLAGGADEEQQRDDRQRAEGRFDRHAGDRLGDRPGSRCVPNVTNVSATPSTNAKSPMRLTMKAFLPASLADFFL